MTVAVCIASRGRPDALKYSVQSAKKLAVQPGTHFCIALDSDDPTNPLDWEEDDVYLSVESREDSLGAKYNRAASLIDSQATVIALGNDDSFMSCEGWDRKLLYAASKFEDGVGVIYYGDRTGPMQLPDALAVTRGWIEKVGYFMPEYFPFWWHDTWIDELARFTGRYVWTDITWAKYGSSEVNGHKTTRMREVAWWAFFFDVMRVKRMEQAKKIITELDYPVWLREQMLDKLPGLSQAFEHRNSLVRKRAAEFEQGYGAEGVVDEGYERLKNRAEEMLSAG
jgi:hypothetical protein